MKKLSTLLLAMIAGAAYATPILPGPETPLQTILNTNIVGTSINVNTDQVVADAYWSAAMNPAAYMLIEIAGYAGQNTFGIYKQGSPSTKQQVFAGSVSGPSGPAVVVVPGSWTSFGFYMYNPNKNFTWYSDNSLNTGGGLDHFAFFQGAAGATLNGWTFDANDYVIAIEDLNLGDKDYNDMVVLVQNVRAPMVPEGGATIALLGLALTGLAVLRRKTA